MLLGNYSVHNRNPLRFLGGSGASPEVNHQPNFVRGGAKKNRQYVEQTTAANKQFSLPYGHYPPYMWQLPQKGGDLAARRSSDFGFTATATGVKGMPGEGSASFSITTNTPAGELIVSGSGSASFAITTNEPLLTASVNGAGTASFEITTNTPILGAIAGMVGSASMAVTTNAPTMYPLDDSSPLRTGGASFSFSASLTRYAIGHMEGTTVDNSVLTTTTISAALVQALYDETIPVDVKKINSVTLTGTGTSGDEWGPQ